MTICYVTFGTKYAHEEHPIDRRAHPTGWFEYEADTFPAALGLAVNHLQGKYAFEYVDRPGLGRYPRGCLARFVKGADGGVTDAPQATTTNGQEGGL